VDRTSLFKIPRCIYIKGTARVETLTEKRFEEVLSCHGWLTRRIFRRLAKDGLENSSLIEVEPEKFITFGLFGKMNEQQSFSVPKEI
jgi:hypothetical protein